MAGRQYQNVSYGLNQPFNVESPSPVIAKRDPTASDFAMLTTIWTNTVTNTIWILASISNNAAHWVEVEAGGGAGIFASLTVVPGPISLTGTTTINTAGAATTTIGTGGTGAVNIGNATGNTGVTGALNVSGNIASTTGNISAVLGSLNAGTTVTAGTGITSTAGNIVASAGNITATLGNISATAGSLNAGTTVTAGTGITSTAGNIVATAGQVNAATSMTAGTTVTAGTGITATTGNIVASTGNITATLGNVTLGAATATFVFGNGVSIHSGTGDPNGVVTAAEGSLYLNTNGTGVGDRAWINTNSGTTWTAITTAT